MLFSLQFLRYLHRDPRLLHAQISLDCTLQSPISVRKIIITACQTWHVERDLFLNASLPRFRDTFSREFISNDDFTSSLAETVRDPVFASILWMFARTCLEPSDNDESATVAREGFEKEVGASQTITHHDQQVSYSAFFRHTPGINDPGHWWIDQVHKIGDTFIKRMSQRTLFPHVNRKKNVSDETAQEYQIFATDRDYVRSVDIEMLYHQTGHKTQGNAELRTAWKFNDLKPRLYYCNGGQQYWASTYMKVIAVALMEAIPSTHVKLRITPTDFLSSNLTDYVMAWDFTSFTTSLSELKHFLWYIARVLEKNSVTTTLFDFRFGYVENVPVHELLDTYNEVANLHAPFEVHRMIGVYLTENHLTLHQVNSGMLGVAGNIGFSTALHGYVTCRECGAHRCVCVGDDALGIVSQDPNVSLIPSLRALGSIHPDKFGVIRPYEEHERPIKFLKRKFERVGQRFKMNFLLNVPIAPYIDGEAGNRTVPIDFSVEARVFKFATSVGSVLWEVYEHPELEDSSVQLLLSFLRLGYKCLRLPLRGLLPGMTFPFSDGPQRTVVGFTLPNIDGLDPRAEDWMDYLIANAPAMFFQSPVYMLRVEDVPLVKGEWVMAPESVYYSLLEDMGYVESENIKEWIYVASVDSKRKLRRMVRRDVDDGTVLAQSIKCIKDIPYHFTPPRSRVMMGLEVDVEMQDDL